MTTMFSIFLGSTEKIAAVELPFRRMIDTSSTRCFDVRKSRSESTSLQSFERWPDLSLSINWLNMLWELYGKMERGLTQMEQTAR
eukprot:scaffold111528_cov41-Attheya_sp.AAC.1